MGVSSADYLSQLQALLPRGLVWPTGPAAVLTRLLQAWADEFWRIDLRSGDLVNEADPRTTTELLADWERVAGLPDVCVTVAQTIEQRRSNLTAKLIMQGGQSRAYYIDLAVSMGYLAASIDEFALFTCNSTCNDAVYAVAAVYQWRLNLPAATGGIFVMSCISDCVSSLRSWGDQAIECRINHYKPAHTQVLFAYP